MTNAQIDELRKSYESRISDLETEVRGLREANANWQEQYKAAASEAAKFSRVKKFLVDEIISPAIGDFLKHGNYVTLQDVEDHLDDNNNYVRRFDDD